jgi:cytochrome c
MPISVNKAAIAFMVAGLAGQANAQFTYPNCGAIENKDFTVTTVFNRTKDADIFEPLKMDFAMDDEGNVNVFYIERKGALKYYDAKAKTVRKLGTITVESTGEDGLVGFALDPEFKTKKRFFAYYSAKTDFHISRFDLDPATLELKAGSEKILMKIPSARGRWHTSGAMRFDAYGNLYINAGDNETMLKGPANTNSWRGSILRIKPKEDGTYSIPEGNLWEVAAKQFEDKGNATVAAKYRDSTKAKREVFVKGIRNAYTLTVDPVRQWATWGDCGPDQQSSGATDTALWTEEHNVATEAGFYGWPFWTARNSVQKVKPYSKETDENAAWADWTTQNPAGAINPFPGTAIPELPPAKTGTNIYAHSCAMTGPIYRYDGGSASTVKFPPHFNRAWFVTDFNNGKIKGIKLTNEGKMTGSPIELFAGLSPNFNKPLDFQAGPDGALYYLNYSCGPWNSADACTGIYRIEYKGTCQDPNLKPETVAARAQAVARATGVEIRPGLISIRTQGGYNMAVYDMSGKALRSFSSEGAKDYQVASLMAGAKPGIYFVRVKNEAGYYEGRISHFP